MSRKTTIIFLAVLCLEIAAQVQQCPEIFPEECSCRDSLWGPMIKCLTNAMDTWDIKETFDKISVSINNTRSVMNNIIVDATLLGQPQEVPANSILTLQTSQLEILANGKLTSINPNAFPGAHSSALVLMISQMNFTNPREAFDHVNNFETVLWTYIWEGSQLVEIPENALHSNLIHLQITGAGLQAIGDNAFVDAPYLQTVLLYDNDLSIEQISDNAFNFSSQDVRLNLHQNAGITHLPYEKFGNFLNTNSNMLYVGPGSTDNPNYFLHCDERADWICAIDLTRISGYVCKEPEYVDIHDYCQQKFDHSSLH